MRMQSEILISQLLRLFSPTMELDVQIKTFKPVFSINLLPGLQSGVMVNLTAPVW